MWLIISLVIGNIFGDLSDNQLASQFLSIFFLVFYLILIVIQFFCMIWHRYEYNDFRFKSHSLFTRSYYLRISTLWHYIGYIQIPNEQADIKRINQRKKEHRERQAGPVIEEIDDEGTNDADDQDDKIVYDDYNIDVRLTEQSDSKSDDEVFETSHDITQSRLTQSKF